MNSFLETSDTLEDIKKNQAIAFLAPNPDLLKIISIEEKKSAKEKKLKGSPYRLLCFVRLHVC